MRKILMLVISLILILAARPTRVKGQARRTVQPASDVNWATTKLGTIPKKYDPIISILFSPNGRRVAAVVGGPRACLVIDGNSETEIFCSSMRRFPAILGEAIFSPDGSKFAYVAHRDPKFSVVMNGREGKLYDEIDDLVFSPDSQKLAYVAGEQGKNFVVVNDEEGIPYDHDSYSGVFSPPVFSPNSQKLAFVVRRGEKSVVVVKDKDGEKQRKPYDWVRSLTFSLDSQKIIYVAKQGGQRSGGGGKEFVVIGDSAGDHEGRQYDLIMGQPIFSPDGQELAYIAVDGGKHFVVVGDRTGKKYDSIGSITFLPGTQQIVYAGRKDNKSFMVVGDKESKPYESIWNWVISPDGKTVMLVAEEGVKQITSSSWSVERMFIVIGNKEGKRYWRVAPYGKQHGPVFSPDSKNFAYVAIRGRELKNFFVVVGDREGKDYDDIRSLVFGPDSKVLAYVAQKASKQLVVIGNKEGKPFDEVATDPVFSPDSKKIAYGARLGNDLWWIVEDVPR